MFEDQHNHPMNSKICVGSSKYNFSNFSKKKHFILFVRMIRIDKEHREKNAHNIFELKMFPKISLKNHKIQ